MTTILNQSIGQAFDRELARMLRHRFLWLCALWIGLTAFIYLLRIVPPIYGFLTGSGFDFQISDPSDWWVWLFGEFSRLLLFGVALWFVYRKCHTQQQILRVAFWTLILFGLSCIILRIDPDQPLPTFGQAGADETGNVSRVISSASWIALAHLFMCMFLPWTPGQAARPLLVLAPIWLLASFAYQGISEDYILHGFFLAPLLSAFGLFICWVRHSQLWENVETSVLRRHFNEARRELIDARRIHEARFPAAIDDGPVRFEYAYEPMREIGGDFLHVRNDSKGHLHVALIDVTGHGITAALAVNRIDGELARIVAENPNVSPDELLALLNRYIHLTMARHSLYATAFCFSIGSDGELFWVNGGHPPAFVRRSDGRIDSLDSTTFMLGACAPDAFDPAPETSQLDDDDVLIVYTDGACEAVDGRGRQFGIRGLVQAIEQWQPGSDIDILPFLPDTVRNYRSGTAQDDVLFTATRLGMTRH